MTAQQALEKLGMIVEDLDEAVRTMQVVLERAEIGLSSDLLTGEHVRAIVATVNAVNPDAIDMHLHGALLRKFAPADLQHRSLTATLQAIRQEAKRILDAAEARSDAEILAAGVDPRRSPVDEP